MTAYYIELFNHSTETVYSYHIIAANMYEAIKRAKNDQVLCHKALRYEIETLRAQIDE